jgi:radical SAM protein with 4Fe4S-binding SPASM domain
MNRRKLKKAIKRIANLPTGKYLLFYITNKIRHFYFKFTKSTTIAYPSTIMLELTNHCNLHCTTCPREYGYGKEMDKGNMQVDQAKRVIDEVWPYLDSIGLTGMGETFLYQEISQIADYIKFKNKGIIISVSTNAVLPDFIEKVSMVVNKIDTIQVSIDGLTTVYESIRKNACFEDLDKNLRLLVASCKNTQTMVMLNMVVTKENFIQMSDLVRYCEEIGVEYIDFTLFNLASVTSIDQSYYDFYKSTEFLNVISDMKAVADSCKGVTITNKNFTTENGFQKCPFPWTHFYVCWNGFITPCCAKPFPKEMNFGNVFDDSMMNILNSESYKHFRTLWFKNQTPDFCQKCHFIDIEPVGKTSVS